MSRKRRFMLVPFSAIAIVLAVASMAFACTIIAGTARITSISHAAGALSSCAAGSTDCAAPGDLVTVDASGAYRESSPGAVIQYYLWFLNYAAAEDSMGTCMAKGGDEIGGLGASEPMLIGGPAQASASGDIPQTTGRVPAASPTGPTQSTLGPARVCFMGSSSPGTGTVNDVKRTVLTRVAKSWGTLSDTLTIVAI